MFLEFLPELCGRNFSPDFVLSELNAVMVTTPGWPECHPIHLSNDSAEGDLLHPAHLCQATVQLRLLFSLCL